MVTVVCVKMLAKQTELKIKVLTAFLRNHVIHDIVEKMTAFKISKYCELTLM